MKIIKPAMILFVIILFLFPFSGKSASLKLKPIVTLKEKKHLNLFAEETFCWDYSVFYFESTSLELCLYLKVNEDIKKKVRIPITKNTAQGKIYFGIIKDTSNDNQHQGKIAISGGYEASVKVKNLYAKLWITQGSRYIINDEKVNLIKIGAYTKEDQKREMQKRGIAFPITTQITKDSSNISVLILLRQVPKLKKDLHKVESVTDEPVK
jgi:hypothetical protein